VTPVDGRNAVLFSRRNERKRRPMFGRPPRGRCRLPRRPGRTCSRIVLEDDIRRRYNYVDRTVPAQLGAPGDGRHILVAAFTISNRVAINEIFWANESEKCRIDDVIVAFK